MKNSYKKIIASFIGILLILIMVTSAFAQINDTLFSPIWTNGVESTTITFGESATFTTGYFGTTNAPSYSVQMDVFVVDKSTGQTVRKVLGKTYTTSEALAKDTITVTSSHYQKEGNYLISIRLTDGQDVVSDTSLSLTVKPKISGTYLEPKVATSMIDQTKTNVIIATPTSVKGVLVKPTLEPYLGWDLTIQDSTEPRINNPFPDYSDVKIDNSYPELEVPTFDLTDLKTDFDLTTTDPVIRNPLPGLPKGPITATNPYEDLERPMLERMDLTDLKLDPDWFNDYNTGYDYEPTREEKPPVYQEIYFDDDSDDDEDNGGNNEENDSDRKRYRQSQSSSYFEQDGNGNWEEIQMGLVSLESPQEPTNWLYLVALIIAVLLLLVSNAVLIRNYLFG